MQFGTTEIERPLCLAPMEDVADRPFRLLCKRLGADVLYTEFANCEAIVRDVTREMEKMRVTEAERPIGAQIYGSNEAAMERAAMIAATHGADFIDINCGCWVKKIANRGDGAGLLRDLPRMRAVVAAAQRGTSLPVTVKTRLGWDEDSIVILEVARMLEDMGIQSLTVHCRTRAQGYSGRADWSWLSRIREISAIPLVGNGDIVTPQDVLTCFRLGCDGVMIGRAAIHAPWVFRDIKCLLETGEYAPEMSLRDRIALCIEHFRAHVAHRGMPRGIYSFRRYYGGYLKGVPGVAQLRRELVQMTDMDAIIERLERFAAFHGTQTDENE